MEKFYWFMGGFFTCGLLNLIFGVGPDKAADNLRSWWRVFFG